MTLVTVVGDLLEDVVVWLDGDMVTGTDNPATTRRRRGGSAANVAAAIAAAGGSARFIGRVGDDALGQSLAGELTASGVDVRVQRSGPTGSVVVLVDRDGERTMFPDRGAAADLDTIDPSWLDGTAVLHVPAYGLSTETSARAIGAAAARVRAAGGSVTVDVSATTLIALVGRTRFMGIVDGLAPAVLFANSSEAVMLGLIDATPAPGRTVIVKSGADPAIALSPDGRRAEVAAVRVADLRDTTGGGDAFAGGFLVEWSRGTSIDAACAAGHRCAAALLVDAAQRDAP